jgi:hypothetical protein
VSERKGPDAGGVGASGGDEQNKLERSTHTKSQQSLQAHLDNIRGRFVDVDPRFRRFAESYIAMARNARYRPAAPGDGCGGIYLTAAELNDRTRLRIEAIQYALEFYNEEERTALR